MMTPLRIFLDATDGSGKKFLENIPEHRITDLKLEAVFGIPGGMKSGAPSVILVTRTPEGGAVCTETSLALLQAAVKALTARYGDHAGAKPPAPPEGP